MSRILVTDSSPITSPGDGERRLGYPPGNAMAHAMTSSHTANQFGRTNFSKSLSPTADQKSGSTSQPLQRGSSASSSLKSMAARMNAKSANALPLKSSSSGITRRERSLSSETVDSHGSQKRFKTGIEKYAYQGPGEVKKKSPIVIDDDDDSSLSSAGPSEPKEQPKKKKRFILGGKRAASKVTSEDESWEAKTNTAATSLSARSEESDVSDQVQSAADHISSLHKSWDKDRIIAELKKTEKNGELNSLTAMISLKSFYNSPKIRDTQTFNSIAPRSQATTPPQRTASYLKGTTPHRPIGKGIQVTSRVSSASPVFVSHNKAPPRKDLVSKAMERVKSSTNSVRSSISISDNSDDGSTGSSDDGYEHDRKDKIKALQWFNQADDKALMEIVGISAAQAATIIDIRPFSSPDDATTKLADKSAKGVTAKLFTNCVDLMAGLHEVDGVLEKCEKMGNKLDAELEKWRSATSEGGGDEFYLHGQPAGLSEGVQLKDFQLHGVNWLNLLYRKDCSGILADDMGLGKTAQVIAFLNVIIQRHKKDPHLIVVPSSVLTNWMREFKVFGPNLQVFKYHGSQAERGEQRDRLRHERDNYDVVITTYDMASGGEMDHNFLRKYSFDACIFDEGHILKNQKSMKYTKLLKLRAKWRLLLTGTPLQNNLGELISLLKFIMPTYFRGAEEALGQIFKVKQQNQLSKERVGRAKSMMQPFLLRRKKVDVLLDLKPKTEVVKYCDMTPEQSKIYKDAYARSRAALLQQEEQAAQAALTRGKKAAVGKNQSGHVLMELRKAANHPLLFRRIFTDKKIEALAKDYLKNSEHADEDLTTKKEDFAINSDAELSMSVAAQYKSCHKHMLAPTDWLNSGKIAALRQVIEEASSQGERLIIFSQFVQTLEIICRALEVLQISYRGFTGSTDVDSRQEIVDEFTRDDSITCFLLSTRAGGVGINLTAANWVVLFDQDFNPQNDRQAADRAYRIGQEKQVTIVRLISKNTIDEQILELGKSKLKLAERVEGGAAVDDAEEMAANQEEVEAKVEQTLLARLVQDDDDDVQDIKASNSS